MNKKLKLCFFLSLFLSFNACNMLQGPGGKNGSAKSTYKIAFSSNASGYYEIYTMNSDGSNRVKLTDHSNSSNYDKPAFSNNGSWIVFTDYNYSGNYYVLYKMQIDGSSLTVLTVNGGSGYSYQNRYAVFSPNDSTLVFDSARDGLWQIYTMDINGNNQSRVLSASSGVNDMEADYSPDGSTILFTHRVGSYYQAYTMNIGGSNQVALTSTSTGHNLDSKYSHDGSKITFSSSRDDGSSYEIYIMDADGSNQTRLTNNSLDDRYPCFTPDGKILFERYSGTKYQIYAMNPDGSNQTNLSNNSYNDRHPHASKAVF